MCNTLLVLYFFLPHNLCFSFARFSLFNFFLLYLVVKTILLNRRNTRKKLKYSPSAILFKCDESSFSKSDMATEDFLQAAENGNLNLLNTIWNEERVNRELDLIRDEATGQGGVHCAAGKGQLEVLIWLYERNASTLLRDNEGCTAAHYAAAEGHVEVLKWLLENGIDMTCGDYKNIEPIEYAEIADQRSVISWYRSQSRVPAVELSAIYTAGDLDSTRLWKQISTLFHNPSLFAKVPVTLPWKITPVFTQTNRRPLVSTTEADTSIVGGMLSVGGCYQMMSHAFHSYPFRKSSHSTSEHIKVLCSEYLDQEGELLLQIFESCVKSPPSPLVSPLLSPLLSKAGTRSFRASWSRKGSTTQTEITTTNIKLLRLVPWSVTESPRSGVIPLQNTNISNYRELLSSVEFPQTHNNTAKRRLSAAETTCLGSKPDYFRILFMDQSVMVLSQAADCVLSSLRLTKQTTDLLDVCRDLRRVAIKIQSQVRMWQSQKTVAKLRILHMWNDWQRQAAVFLKQKISFGKKINDNNIIEVGMIELATIETNESHKINIVNTMLRSKLLLYREKRQRNNIPPIYNYNLQLEEVLRTSLRETRVAGVESKPLTELRKRSSVVVRPLSPSLATAGRSSFSRPGGSISSLTSGWLAPGIGSSRRTFRMSPAITKGSLGTLGICVSHQPHNSSRSSFRSRTSTKRFGSEISLFSKAESPEVVIIDNDKHQWSLPDGCEDDVFRQVESDEEELDSPKRSQKLLLMTSGGELDSPKSLKSTTVSPSDDWNQIQQLVREAETKLKESLMSATTPAVVAQSPSPPPKPTKLRLKAIRKVANIKTFATKLRRNRTEK